VAEDGGEVFTQVPGSTSVQLAPCRFQVSATGSAGNNGPITLEFVKDFEGGWWDILSVPPDNTPVDVRTEPGLNCMYAPFGKTLNVNTPGWSGYVTVNSSGNTCAGCCDIASTDCYHLDEDIANVSFSYNPSDPGTRVDYTQAEPSRFSMRQGWCEWAIKVDKADAIGTPMGQEDLLVRRRADGYYETESEDSVTPWVAFTDIPYNCSGSLVFFESIAPEVQGTLDINSSVGCPAIARFFAMAKKLGIESCNCGEVLKLVRSYGDRASSKLTVIARAFRAKHPQITQAQAERIIQECFF
jgi:hypothetical protein